MSQEENNAIPAYINDELAQLERDYWSTAENDHREQIAILFQMINILTDALIRISSKK
tara:strand:+ start:336 stop:509 length:174 start_codon:yes stop_codon:yes gene_type:complete